METKIGRLVKRDFLFLDELIFESVEYSNRFFSLSINFHIPFILLVRDKADCIRLIIHSCRNAKSGKGN